MTIKEVIERIRTSAQLAAILEVSGWPKPGNVHRTVNHSDTRYEQFLAGSIALGSSAEAAALKGLKVARKEIEISEVGVGKLVKKAVLDMANSHYGGNTHLGTCLLLIPLAVAAGKTQIEKGQISATILRDNVKDVMESTTPKDTVEVYKAIASVSSSNELGELIDEPIPDLYDEQAEYKILTNKITLFDVMKQSSSYDAIARELATGMEISFEVGYEELTETFSYTHDINAATVHTFLRILSGTPDTFIARKVGTKSTSDVKKAVESGRKETIWISETAEKILKLGGLTTEEGEASLWEFDKKLQKLGKDYSPGTTADLTTASLMIALLNGLKF
jgi:triphosphoribosyl-dephospho-CoA synthase